MVLLEFRQIEQQLKIAREERLLDQSQANRELIRNLAHEIKNPLGGIRGAAQLLDRELERPALHEYTQVIMKEADRLQSLMDRLLTPHRLPQPAPLNVHEVLERVRSLILAEFPQRHHDPPRLRREPAAVQGDKEQLIQAVLNIARNAAQAIGKAGAATGEIALRTRVVRQVTLARRRYRHAIAVEIIGQRPRHSGAICASACSIRWCPGAKAAAGWGSRSRRPSSTSTTASSRSRACRATPCFTILLPAREPVNGNRES